jgi:hypothetical protein
MKLSLTSLFSPMDLDQKRLVLKGATNASAPGWMIVAGKPVGPIGCEMVARQVNISPRFAALLTPTIYYCELAVLF